MNRKKGIFMILFSLVLSIFIFSSTVTAESVQTLSFGNQITGEISETTKTQTYTVNLVESGLLSIDFSSYIDTVNLQLEDANGKNIISDNIHDGTSTDPRKMRAAQYLEAGMYYVKVNYYTGHGKYDLKVNFEASNNNEIEPNNGTAEAQVLKFDQKVTGLISWSDHLDTYKLDLEKSGQIALNFASYIDTVNLQLEDVNGKNVISNNVYDGKSTDPKKTSATQYLEAGTYYVKVNYYTGHGKYDFEVNFEAANNNEIEPNNGTVEAQTLELNQQLTGLISWNDHLDTYKLNVQKPGKIALNFASYIDTVNLQLEDVNGKNIINNNVYDGNSTDPKKTRVTQYLEAGTYYIKVNYYTGHGKYDLFVSNMIEFPDVDSGKFYYDSIMKLTSLGIISGYPDGTFHPNTALTREQSILLLFRALDLEVPDNYEEISSQFTDLGRNYRYAKEVAAVYQQGIYLGFNNKMGIKDNLSREQMASVLVRAFNLQGDSSINSLSEVVDAKNISSAHNRDVETLYDLNVTKGKEKGKFIPQDSITRGEFVTFLDRVM